MPTVAWGSDLDYPSGIAAHSLPIGYSRAGTLPFRIVAANVASSSVNFF